MAGAPEMRDDEVLKLARRVAALSGESETQAVIISLQERLARLERDRARREILEKARAEWRANPAVMSAQEAADLYDEHGLPK